MRIRAGRTNVGTVALPGGGSRTDLDLGPIRQVLRQRHLHAPSISKELSRPQRVEQPVTFEILNDISLSMRVQNDACGLRNEAMLVLLEYYARNLRRRPLGGQWLVEGRTFNNGGTPLDFGATPIDRRHIPRIGAALLSSTNGGPSVLGPVLDASIARGADREGALVRIILTDWELFDTSVSEVVERLATAPAMANLVVVFNADETVGPDDPRIVIRRVDPRTANQGAVTKIVHDVVETALSAERGRSQVPGFM